MSTIPTYHSLSRILNRVKQIIDDNVAGKSFWLKVEIANINFHRSGHTYIELAENVNGKTIAKCKAMIWSIQNQDIQRKLGKDYSNVLKKGNEILCNVSINFGPEYGLSIQISEINLEFAVGQIEKRRQETLDRLKKEGLLDLNKKHAVPLVIKSIALIASKNTSGYADFVKYIQNNQYGYKFDITLFSTSVQGDIAISEITSKLKNINHKKYDCVVIIRGGGSKMDLDVFNSYLISQQVSQMHSPVFSGIGHETDVSVLDFSANKAFKTPTEVASFIIGKSYAFEQNIINYHTLIMEWYHKSIERRQSKLRLHTEGIANASNSFTQLRRGALHTLMNRVLSVVRISINESHNYLALSQQNALQFSISSVHSATEVLNKNQELLFLLAKRTISQERSRLDTALVLASSNSPKGILNKGFVIPRIKGNLYQGEALEPGTEIKLEFADTTIITQYIKKL